MVKFILGFVSVVMFASSVFAVEVEIVPNDDDVKKDEQPFLLSFDGNTDVNQALLAKILECNKKFSVANKKHLSELLEHRGGVENLQESFASMKRNPAATEQLTLSNRELNESFVKGQLKDCLSK